MNMIITFDICSIFILAFLSISLFLRKMTKGFSNKIFIILIYIVLLSALADILCVTVPCLVEPSPFTKNLIYFFNYIYFLSHNSITPVYQLFIFTLCGMWHDFIGKKRYKILWGLPIVFELIGFVLNPFTHVYFSISDSLVYSRGDGILILYFVALYYVFFCIFCLIKKHSLISPSKFWLLISLFPIDLIGIILQFRFPNFLLETLSSAIPLLLIYIVVLRPEEIISFETESLNFYAYQEDLKKNFIAKRPMNIIFIFLVNYSEMQKQIRSENLQKFLTELFKNIHEICAIGETEVYYLNSGLFSVVSLKTDENEMYRLAERINIFFHQKVKVGIMDFSMNTKICLARCPQNLSDLNSVLTFGKNFSDLIFDMNKVVYLDTESKTVDFQVRNQINEILTKAIKNHAFEIFYQPIYNLHTGKFSSAEALVRLNDENFGFISPNLFILASEKSGAIHQIGDFIFEEVFDFLSENEIHDYGVDYIEINLSVAQCIERDLFYKIRSYLEAYSITPDKINFEITETEIEFTREVSDKNIQLLHDYGINFSLDDYGTGYSNIKRLTSLPFNIIKLDKTFADDFENPQMRIIIDGTVNMLKKLNKKILIEGVSDKKTLDYFTNLGCDFIQGFYYSMPLPKEKFLEFVKENNIQK